MKSGDIGSGGADLGSVLNGHCSECDVTSIICPCSHYYTAPVRTLCPSAGLPHLTARATRGGQREGNDSVLRSVSTQCSLADLEGENADAGDVTSGTAGKDHAESTAGDDVAPVSVVAEDEDAGVEADEQVAEGERVRDRGGYGRLRLGLLKRAGEIPPVAHANDAPDG